MDFVTTGGRIKYYRNLLHLTPKELTMGRITPAMIYSLENNKRKLTPVTASILVSNFHEIANARGIQIDLEMKDFFISDKEYANTLCNKWLIDTEEGSFDKEKCLRIVKLAKEYNLNGPIAIVYKKMSLYYFNEKNYSTASKYYKALLHLSSLLINQNEEIDILNRIGTCYYMLNDYENAFFYYNKGYDNFLKFNVIDTSLEDKLLYNMTLTSFAKKDYIKAEMYVEKLISLSDIEESEMYTDLILKANIYMKTDRFQEALKLYKEILKHDIKLLYIVQHNMAIAYMSLGRLEESIEFFTLSINNQLHSLSPDTTLSLVNLAEVYYKEKKYDEAVIFFDYGLNNANKFQQLDRLILCYEGIYKTYNEICRIDKFDSYYESLKNLYTNITFNEEQQKKLQAIEQNYISEKE